MIPGWLLFSSYRSTFRQRALSHNLEYLRCSRYNSYYNKVNKQGVGRNLDLVGTSEVAEMLSVSKQTLTNWRLRNPEFPQPIAELKAGPVWNREEVIAWAKKAGIQVAAMRSKQSTTVPHKRDAVVVAVVNMKGGVGKSTVTANLGWHSAYKKNHKVLLVDLDPQFNLSQYALGSEQYEELLKRKSPTVYNIFEQTSLAPGARKTRVDLKDAICNVKSWTDGSRLDLIPSRLDLAWTLKSPYGKPEHLANFLEPLKKTYDLILIDCPPTQSMLTDAAYASSDYVLIPVKPEFLSTIGLPLLIKSLEDYKLEHPGRSDIEIVGILFNAVSEVKAEHQRSKHDVMALAKKNHWYVFKNEISYSDSYPKGSREGKPIFLTGYARWDRVNEFESLANEFLERIGL